VGGEQMAEGVAAHPFRDSRSLHLLLHDAGIEVVPSVPAMGWIPRTAALGDYSFPIQFHRGVLIPRSRAWVRTTLPHPVAEVEILHPQPQGFHESQSAAAPGRPPPPSARPDPSPARGDLSSRRGGRRRLGGDGMARRLTPGAACQGPPSTPHG
jgi:hypothetical protein